MQKQLIFQNKKKFANLISSMFPRVLFYISKEELYLKTSSTHVWKLLFFLKHHTNALFSQLINLSFVDYPDKKFRFEVFYNLLSLTYNNRITVTTSVPDTIALESIVSIYSAANWYEREAWDMFGVVFNNHPDLRRMLTDYGFKGHPLRKDFPMTGYVEVRYDDFTKRIAYEEISLTQEYRIFNLENPWNSLNHNSNGLVNKNE